MSLFRKKKSRLWESSFLDGADEKKEFFGLHTAVSKKISWKKSIFFGFFFVVIFLVSLFLWAFSPFFFLLSSPLDHLGFFGKKTYLITLHNEGELRPTLGFLTGFVLVSAENGKISTAFLDSYAVSPPKTEQKAPKILEEKFGEDEKFAGWTFRDSNFSPNYSQNVEDAKKFLSYDERFADFDFDAVIAIDLYAIERFVDAVGGIFIGEKKLYGEDVFSFLEQQSKNFDKHDFDAWKNRKSGVGEFAAVLMKNMAFSPFSWEKISETSVQMAQEKHLIFSFADKNLQQKIDEKNWDGNWDFSQNDAPFSFNIANVAGRKSDRYIEKKAVSFLEQDEKNRWQENFSLQFSHRGSYNLHSNEYFAFVRIFRPKGTTLKSFDGKFLNSPKKETVSSVPNTEEFSFFVHVSPKNQENFSFVFDLPKSWKDQKQWNFSVFRQAGLLDTSVSMIFSAPFDAGFSVKNCAEGEKKENIFVCLLPKTDTVLAVSSIPDTFLPIFERAEILREQKKIVLHFSENIKPVKKSEIALVSKENAPSLSISNVQNIKNTLVLDISEEIPTEKFFYEIRIAGLSDVSGNAIELFQNTLSTKP